MPTVVFSFLTGNDIRQSSYAISIFDAIRQHLDGATLGNFGDVEPLRGRFSVDNSWAQLWGNNLFWQQASCNGSGAVLHGTSKRHTNINFYYDFECVNEASAFPYFLKTIATMSNADFSSCHCFDGKSANENDEIFEGINSHDLRDGLPMLPWATCFGPHYSKVLNLEPSQSEIFIEHMPHNFVYVQLAKLPSSYWTEHSIFITRQMEIKHSIGQRFFRDGEQPAKVPELNLQ